MSERYCGNMVNPRPDVVYPEAKVKPKWQMPPAPMCGECKKRMHAAAHHTGEGWDFDWSCDCGEYVEDPPEFTWPFIDDFVFGRDLEAIGFEVM